MKRVFFFSDWLFTPQKWLFFVLKIGLWKYKTYVRVIKHTRVFTEVSYDLFSPSVLLYFYWSMDWINVIFEFCQNIYARRKELDDNDNLLEKAIETRAEIRQDCSPRNRWITEDSVYLIGWWMSWLQTDFPVWKCWYVTCSCFCSLGSPQQPLQTWL